VRVIQKFLPSMPAGQPQQRIRSENEHMTRGGFVML